MAVKKTKPALKVALKKERKKSALKIKAKKAEGKLIGKVRHYFSNINVAVIGLSFPLSQGDEVRIVGGENTDFNQKISSMQIDHQEVAKAKKGNAVGIK